MRAMPAFLEIGTIATSFQREGKIPFDRLRLNIYFSTGMNSSEIIKLVISFEPTNFVELWYQIVRVTSELKTKGIFKKIGEIIAMAFLGTCIVKEELKTE
jgi:hypothetical protein